MTRRRVLIVVAVLVVGVVVLQAVSGQRPRATTRQSKSSPAPAIRAYKRPPVLPGAPESPHAVLYQFATAYSNLSGETPASRYQVMVSLAAPPLLTQLRAGGVRAQSALFDGGPSVEGKLLSLSVFGPVGSYAHGAVDIELRGTGPKAVRAAPLDTSFVADLVEVGGVWRVSNFTLVP
jgi:hypothetical protein